MAKSLVSCFFDSRCRYASQHYSLPVPSQEKLGRVRQKGQKGKGKVFPYSLPSVGPGADPDVQAVSPQVT